MGLMDGCPLPCVAAQHRVSTFPGAEEGGWRFINKTGIPQRLLERSPISGQLPLLPQDSKEERQVTAATVLSTALLSRRLPAGKIRAGPCLAARCLEAEWHGLTSDTQDPDLLAVNWHTASLRRVPSHRGRCRVRQDPKAESDIKVISFYR